MKKIISYMLSLVILVSTFSCVDFSAYADTTSGKCGINVTWSYDTSTYTLTISGSGTMANYSFSNNSPYYSYSYCTHPWYQYYNSIKRVKINSGVTSIGDYAFYKCKSLTSITIPNSVTSIGNYAFCGCTGLKELTMPCSVKIYNSEYTFCNCSNIEKVTLTKGTGTMQDYENDLSSSGKVTYYEYTPWYISRSNLKEVVIETGVSSIGNYVFRNCSSLTSITIPDSVTSIGIHAFYDCINLTSVTIPDSVTIIGSSAFYDCINLTSVTIPDSVTIIGSSAFQGCSKSLNSIVVDENNKYYDSRNNCNAIIETSTNKLIVGCKNTIIPDSVTSIYCDAFHNCTSLTSVTIPNSVTSIDYDAFHNCTSLTSVTIPNSVTSIYGRAFYDCSSLKSVTIPDSVTYIGYQAFYNCTNLTSVTIPNSITSICDSVFNGCSSLTSVTIPDSVTSIDGHAFCGCSSLTSITIPNSVTNLSGSAFFDCKGLTSVTIPNSITSICDSVFYGCSSLTSVTIPDSVTNIDRYAFYRCSSLKNVYYCGTEEQWNNISIGNYNNCLLNATIQYNYHIHDCIVLDSIEADCINNGLYIYECKDCGETFIEEPKALGHNTITDKAVAPTCTETGLTEGSHCSRCDTIFIKQKIVEPLCHNYIPTVTKPTCTEKGYTTYNCSRCESKYVDNYTNALNHSFTNYISDSNATCLGDGTKTAKCDRCDETDTIIDTDSKLDHNYIPMVIKPTCTEQGYTKYNCSRCNSEYIFDYVNPLGHTPTTINSIKPTCVDTGLSEGSSCSVCDVVLVEQQIIPAKGHRYELYRTTATCEKAGYDVYKCSVCSNTKTDKVDNHHNCKQFNGVVDGNLSYICSICDNEYIKSASHVLEMWDSNVINASAEEHPELDVVNDGIINAKDYAELKHLQEYNN